MRLRVFKKVDPVHPLDSKQPMKSPKAFMRSSVELLEQLDAMGNLRFVLGTDYREETAAALLAELGLGDVGNKPVRDFSGGMKRRLALARALLAPSDILVLDESFTGLDGENRAKALSCVRRAAAGKPVLLVTHDESDAADLDAALLRL